MSIEFTNYEVRVRCVVNSTSKERIEQEVRDFLEHELYAEDKTITVEVKPI